MPPGAVMPYRLTSKCLPNTFGGLPFFGGGTAQGVERLTLCDGALRWSAPVWEWHGVGGREAVPT